METRVQKWGNSLAIRIPKSIAGEIGLEQDTLVDVSVAEGKLVVTPVERPTFTLDGLLAGITEENRHGEVGTGAPAGDEEW